MKKSEIKFIVSLDEENRPEQLHWSAQDSGMEGEKECKAIMLSLFDKKDQTTMRIDLWTKDMMVEEMKQFFFEMYMSMADTYQNATQDKEMADKLRASAREFGKGSDVIK
jgi:gliding motility-associated protein GldC